MKILSKRRSTCAYPAGLMKGTMALNAKYLAMWKRDRYIDYLIDGPYSREAMSSSSAATSFASSLLSSGPRSVLRLPFSASSFSLSLSLELAIFGKYSMQITILPMPATARGNRQKP